MEHSQVLVLSFDGMIKLSIFTSASTNVCCNCGVNGQFHWKVWQKWLTTIIFLLDGVVCLIYRLSSVACLPSPIIHHLPTLLRPFYFLSEFHWHCDTDGCIFLFAVVRAKVKLFTSHNNMTNYATVWASRTNMEQRRGRAGRVRPGFAFHLCSRTRASRLVGRPGGKGNKDWLIRWLIPVFSALRCDKFNLITCTWGKM